LRLLGEARGVRALFAAHLGRQLRHADADHPQPAGHARAGEPRHRTLQYPAEERRAVEAHLLSRRESLGAQTAEFPVLVPRGARLGCNLCGAGSVMKETAMKRRTLLGLGAAAALSASLPSFARKIKPLRILVLGGTRFIGLHMTALALQRGHTLTFFNRGKTKTDRYPEVERIKGDRNGEIDGLKDREWDAVIDNSGYVPRHVRLSAELLAPKVKQYVFTSSISVYADFSTPRDESSPVGKLADESVEKVDGETYGPLKALCEQAVLTVLPGRATVIRPGLIVGPDDNTDRFTYWPARAARGGEFVAPGSPHDAFQVIDARDLAAFTINAIENNITGTYNLVSNVNEFKFGELTDACVAAA